MPPAEGSRGHSTRPIMGKELSVAEPALPSLPETLGYTVCG